VSEQTLATRVENLERRMELLEGLPARMGAVEVQIRQLRTEMDEQFAAVRAEIRDGDEETRRYMRVLHEEVLSRMAIIQEGLLRRRR
jgi:galactokinase